MTPRERLSKLLAGLGVRDDAPFARPELVDEALTHSSYAAEKATRHNERLEMLGDAVLDFVVADLLFDLFPDAQEGVLTRLRASLANEAALAKRARAIGLGDLLQLGRGEELSGGRDRDSLLADAFEALVAALYRSEGLAPVERLLTKLFRDEALTLARAPQPADFKTALQEKAQAQWRLQPTYRIASSAGPDHERVFVAEVLLGEAVAGRGEGRSKKIAEQAAAQAALAAWDALVTSHPPTSG